jgi:hypothetical protein
VLTHIHPAAYQFAPKVVPRSFSLTASVYGYSTGTAKRPEPLCTQEGVASCAAASNATSASVTLPSSLIRTHAPILNPPHASSLHLCIRSLQVAVSPSRRYLCESFSTCLDPYPGCLCGAFTRFFPQNFGLPVKHTRSALSLIHTIATSVWENFRGCSHSLMFKPVVLLATQVAPTAANIFFFLG